MDANMYIYISVTSVTISSSQFIINSINIKHTSKQLLSTLPLYTHTLSTQSINQSYINLNSKTLIMPANTTATKMAARPVGATR